MHWINHTEMDNSIGVDDANPVNNDLCGRTEIDNISILVNIRNNAHSVRILEYLLLQ